MRILNIYPSLSPLPEPIMVALPLSALVMACMEALQRKG